RGFRRGRQGQYPRRRARGTGIRADHLRPRTHEHPRYRDVDFHRRAADPGGRGSGPGAPPMSTATPLIAVLDVGKTNSKLALVDPALGQEVWSTRRANASVSGA